MKNQMNNDLYERFGLSVDISRIQSGFRSFLGGMLLEKLHPLIQPDFYKQREQLQKIQQQVLKEVCRQLFLDYKSYDDYNYGFKWFIEKEMPNGRGFMDSILRLQVFLNILFTHKLIRTEFGQIAGEIERYLNDFPMLGLMIKVYKARSPQIFPVTSKSFKQGVESTLGVLDKDKKYEHVLVHYENGLKEFLKARSLADYKDVIEDMYTACDELAKVCFGNHNKGFKHIADKVESAQLGLNGHQKELFKHVRNWMDEIKHGTLKKFDRDDTEMIVSMTGSLIRFVIMKESTRV